MGNTQEQRIKYIALDRDQLRWETLDVEGLIAPDHPARIIWEVSGRFDISRFAAGRKTEEGEAGRPCWHPRLLLSVWVYGYTLGEASARAIENWMRVEPGLRWLSGDQAINHHTLSDFRVKHKEGLEQVFIEFLALLEEAGLVDLNTLLQDGTKVKAVAGAGSLHRRASLEQRLSQAKRVVEELDQQAAGQAESLSERRRAAQQRAGREALERAQAALAALEELEAEAGKQAKLRVSVSEPEARNMKHGDGGISPSYNVQVTTEPQSRMIVAIGVTTAANDTQQLMAAIERAEQYGGQTPSTVIADNGYATRANVEQTSERDIQLVAPWKEEEAREAGACARHGIAAEFAPSKFVLQGDGRTLVCPAGKVLAILKQKVHHGVRKDVFEAAAGDCEACPKRASCGGTRDAPRRIERTVESEAMQQYLARMSWAQTQYLYRRRSEVAEFPHLWAKGVKKWRKFSVRGVVKAGIEALWVALAYNITQWIRLRKPVTA